MFDHPLFIPHRQAKDFPSCLLPGKPHAKILRVFDRSPLSSDNITTLNDWMMCGSFGTDRRVSLGCRSLAMELSPRSEQSRQYGFLRFATLEEAEIFMERNYPILYLYGDSSKNHGDADECRVRISYGKERRDNRSADADWICPTVCPVTFIKTHAHCRSATSTITRQD